MVVIVTAKMLMRGMIVVIVFLMKICNRTEGDVDYD